jgi:O-methyltransferase
MSIPSQNNSEKIKVIIFGAGNAAKKITEEIEEQSAPYDIVAYADNDAGLHNTFLFDKPIINPSGISNYDYDQIIIAAIDSHSITNQLTRKCGVSPDKINSKSPYIVNYNAARISALKNVSQLIYESKIQGAVAEVGVFKGDFAQHINAFFNDRFLYLFDTFEGFPENDIEKERELGTKRIIEVSYNYSGTSIDIVLGKMKNPEKCIIRKGYFPETAAGIEDTYAFVSLDADLYQPMLEGLKFFYPRLAKGGFIFVHDYFTDTFTGVRQAVSEYKMCTDIVFTPIGDDCSIAIVKV